MRRSLQETRLLCVVQLLYANVPSGVEFTTQEVLTNDFKCRFILGKDSPT